MRITGKGIAAGILGVAVLWGGVPGHAQSSPGLTLEQVVSLAVQNSRDVALARVRYDVATNQARVDRSPFLPSIETGASPFYNYGFPVAINAQPPTVFQLTYSEEIYDGPLSGEFHAQQEHAKGLEIEVTRTRDAVIVRSATCYLELAKARHSLDLLRNERDSAEKIVDYVRKRAANGMELPIEVTRSELILAKIEQRIVQLTGRSQILTGQLHDLTGLPPEKLEEISPEDLPAMEIPSDDQVQKAVETSPIFKEMQFERSARQDLLNGAVKGYWPTAEIVSQYNVFAKFNDYQNYFTSFQRNNVAFGVLIRIPVFNFKTSASVALARSQLSEADLNLANSRNNATAEAEQTKISVADKNASLDVARLELKLAQESLGLVQTRFDQGQASVKDLEQARLDEGEKWLAFLDADFARQQADLALMQMTGRLSQVFK